MIPEEFKVKAEKTIEMLKDYKKAEILLIHHDDADGLCSAAITKESLERKGYKVKTFCIEKLLPEIIKKVHNGENRVIFYCDIASPHAKLISKVNSGRNLTIILDHHDPSPSEDPMVLDLNLEHFGFKGEEDFSGATCSYLFAKVLDDKNFDLSYLALVGSCEIPVGFVGLNRMVLNESLGNGVIKAKGKSYIISKFDISVKDLFSKLQILGSVGFYIGGPVLGVKVCLEGLTEEAKRLVEDLEEKRKKVNRRIIAMLYKKGFNETEHIQWFDVGDAYKGMGTKTIGTLCSYISYQRKLIKQEKYIIGIMNMEPEIPNFGKLSKEYSKVSVRVPRLLKKLVDRGEMPFAVELLHEATGNFGLAVDGHAYAASCIIPRELKNEMINLAEKFIQSYGKK